MGGERPPFPYPFDRRPTSTNSLISSNLYVDMQAESIKGGDAKISNEFYVSEGAAEFEPSENFFALKKIPVDAEINIASLSENARKLFTGPKGSREKEWANMISQVKESGGPAVRIHRGARAREIKQNYPQRLIPSRWLDKWKDMGDEYETPLSAPEVLEANVPEHHGSKSRWILQGFHDPDITILRRSVPTPETSDVPLCLQMLASLRARGWVADVRGAFSQGMRNQRTEPLFALPPPGGIPGEQEDIVIEILAEIYGLISGPPGWRRSLFTTFKQLDFKAHPLAPCVVLMYEEIDSKPNQFSGLICVETDDLLGGGIGPKYQAAIEVLKKEYNFGKWKILQESSTEYGGRTLKQFPDFSFTISMSRYLRDKASEIKLARGRGKDPRAKADAGEITMMRGLIGKLNWASREGMPQGAGDASLLASKMPNPTVEDLTEANAAMRRLLANDVPVWIRSIPFKDLGLIVFEDASLGNTKGGAAQIGHLVCCCDKKIHTGERADVSVCVYKSHKNPRAAPSTLLNESTGMSEALADSEWVASWIGLCKDLEYDLRKRHLLNREIKIAALTTCHDNSELDLATITDAKSLYDNLMQEQYTGAEKRAALEICVIRDSLDSLGGRARWVPHDRNPADCLTKLKGNVDSLLKLLREGSYQLIEESEEMAQRKIYRETTGKKNPRPNNATSTSMYIANGSRLRKPKAPPSVPVFFQLTNVSSMGKKHNKQPPKTAEAPTSELTSASCSQREVAPQTGPPPQKYTAVAPKRPPFLREYNDDGKDFKVLFEKDLDPRDVRYCQDSIHRRFSDGWDYREVVNHISDRKIGSWRYPDDPSGPEV